VFNIGVALLSYQEILALLSIFGLCPFQLAPAIEIGASWPLLVY